MLKAVLFDLDGTLYDRDLAVGALVAEQFEAFARELSGVPRERFVHAVLGMDDHGHGEKDAGYARVLRELELPAGLATPLIEHFWANLDKHCALPEDTVVTLQTLQANGKRLGMITNGSVDRQRQKIEALDLARWFDTILISEAEGVRKPDAEIFRRALERCGVHAPEAAFVGDHPEADIAGARDAGLTPIWKSVPYWQAPHDVARVARLVDVLPICLSPDPAGGAE